MERAHNFYDWFANTGEMEVCRALANEMYQRPGELSEGELASLATNLATMDEGHAASAVTILSHHDPTRLIPFLPWLLADLRVGVWCAAERALLLLPLEAVTMRMISGFREAVRQRYASMDDCYALKTLANRFAEGTDISGHGRGA